MEAGLSPDTLGQLAAMIAQLKAAPAARPRRDTARIVKLLEQQYALMQGWATPVSGSSTQQAITPPWIARIIVSQYNSRARGYDNAPE